MKQQQMNFDHLSLIAGVRRLVFPSDDFNGYERRLLIALLRAADAYLATGNEVKRINGFSIFTIKRKELVHLAGSDIYMSAATVDRCIDHLKRHGHRFVRIPDIDQRTERCSKPLKFAIDMETLIDAINQVPETDSRPAETADQVDDDEAWALVQRQPSSTPSSPSSPPSSPSSSPSSPSPSSSSPSSSSPPRTPVPVTPVPVTPIPVTPIPVTEGLSNSCPPIPDSGGAGAFDKGFNPKAVRIRLLPYAEETLTSEGVWKYLKNLREGPWARDIAWAVGMRAESEEFERKFLAWCRCVLRMHKELNKTGQPKVRYPVRFFVKHLYGHPDRMLKKTWNQRPDCQDEDDASIKWKQLKFSMEAVEVS